MRAGHTENLSDEQLPKVIQDFFHFWSLAVVAGGVVPALLAFIADRYYPILDPSARDLFIDATVFFAAFSTIGLIASVIWPRTKQCVLWTGSGVSWATLNIFVYTTGGPLHSVFAFHYLYIPAVVSLYFSKATLRCTAICYWGAFLFWIWGPASPTLKLTSANNWVYLSLYCSVFTLQMFMTVVVAHFSRRNRD